MKLPKASGWTKITISVWRNKLTGNYFIDKKDLAIFNRVEQAEKEKLLNGKDIQTHLVQL